MSSYTDTKLNALENGLRSLEEREHHVAQLRRDASLLANNLLQTRKLKMVAASEVELASAVTELEQTFGKTLAELKTDLKDSYESESSDEDEEVEVSCSTSGRITVAVPPPAAATPTPAPVSAPVLPPVGEPFTAYLKRTRDAEQVEESARNAKKPRLESVPSPSISVKQAKDKNKVDDCVASAPIRNDSVMSRSSPVGSLSVSSAGEAVMSEEDEQQLAAELSGSFSPSSESSESFEDLFGSSSPSPEPVAAVQNAVDCSTTPLESTIQRSGLCLPGPPPSPVSVQHPQAAPDVATQPTQPRHQRGIVETQQVSARPERQNDVRPVVPERGTVRRSEKFLTPAQRAALPKRLKARARVVEILRKQMLPSGPPRPLSRVPNEWSRDKAIDKSGPVRTVTCEGQSWKIPERLLKTSTAFSKALRTGCLSLGRDQSSLFDEDDVHDVIALGDNIGHEFFGKFVMFINTGDYDLVDILDADDLAVTASSVKLVAHTKLFELATMVGHKQMRLTAWHNVETEWRKFLQFENEVREQFTDQPDFLQDVVTEREALCPHYQAVRSSVPVSWRQYDWRLDGDKPWTVEELYGRFRHIKANRSQEQPVVVDE